jgi:hypothetical protein
MIHHRNRDRDDHSRRLPDRWEDLEYHRPEEAVPGCYQREEVDERRAGCDVDQEQSY